MIRQIGQNTIKRVLNAKEAREYLGLPRYSFEKAVSNGEIQFKLIGTKKFFPTWALEKWQNDTTNHIDCTKEAKPTTHISRSYRQAVNAYSFAELQDKYFPKKPLSSA